jgi:hypothetical protein
MDNRPLQFEEFENKVNQIVAVSATPNTYEITNSCTSPQPSPLQEKGQEIFSVEFGIQDWRSWKEAKATG